MAQSLPDFVELPENRLASRAVLRLSRHAVAPFHPLTLHAVSGTGKSLLAKILMQRFLRYEEGRSARHLTANELDFHQGSDFQDLLNADLLVIEDLQHLTTSGVALLSRMLDERGRRRRPTMLTANQAPAKLKKLPPRLLGRIAGGLVVAIEPLSVASRKAILRPYLETKRIAIEPEALDWLAARPTGGGMRPLLGVLDTLKARHRGRATPLTLEQVQEIAGETAVGVDRIIRRVAETYGVKERELLGSSRLRSVLLPRQVAMFLARDLALLPLPRISERFDRDGSTVQHAVNKIRTALADDRQLAGTIRQLKLELS